MKNYFMLKSLKFALAFVFILFVSSCSDETDTLNTIDETNVNNTNEQILARVAVAITSELEFKSPVCIDVEQTSTLSGWYGNTSINVEIYDENSLEWISIFSAKDAPSPQSFYYTFTYVKTHLLRYKVGTNNYVEFSVIAENCSDEETGCSLSQGYWFARPKTVWPSDVLVGGKSYTQAEGKLIWKSSNKGGIQDSKKGFLQVATIKLSGNTVLETDTVWDDVKIIEDWLETIEKVTSNTKDSNKAAKEAAGRIGEWIDANHCTEQ